MGLQWHKLSTLPICCQYFLEINTMCGDPLRATESLLEGHEMHIAGLHCRVYADGNLSVANSKMFVR